MTVKRVFSIIGLVLTAYLIGNFFIPFISYGSASYSYWEYNEKMLGNANNIVLLIELIFALIVLLLQAVGVMKKGSLSLIATGAVFTFYLVNMIYVGDNSYMEASAGIWLGLIVSSISLLISIISEFMCGCKKPAPAVSYDPQTGQPINQ